MALPLKESNAARVLAELLYDFLPGSGRDHWKGHVTFRSVAERADVADYWSGGSKQPAIARLLEQTLEFKRHRFQPLILEVVRSGLTYRRKKGSPVTPAEIEKINAQLLAIGFKFPDLWDADFSAALADDSGELARERVRQQRAAESLRETARSRRDEALERLKGEYLTLHTVSDRQAAGLLLEGILNRLFTLNDLEPRAAFRVVGEQIDGSFELDSEVYLLEAKWHKEPLPVKELYAFREVIEGKSRFTRGVFLSVNGISAEAREAIVKGKQPIFFVMDGYDLMMALENKVTLPNFFRRRQRLLAEEGAVSVPFNQCGFGAPVA